MIDVTKRTDLNKEKSADIWLKFREIPGVAHDNPSCGQEADPVDAAQVIRS